MTDLNTLADSVEAAQGADRAWSEMALYLASCAAATLEGLPKRASKHERDRHIGIATKALAMINGSLPPHRQDEAWVKSRLARALIESAALRAKASQ